MAQGGDTAVTTSSSEGNNTVFNVYCRFRPLNQRERLLGKDSQDEPALIQIESPRCLYFNRRPYLFDGIYDDSCLQQTFFNETIEQRLNQFIVEWHDLIILTYGQTSSGKTWTIDGSFYDDNRHAQSKAITEAHHGLLPRVLQRLCLSQIDQSTSTYKVAFYEIYCEKIIDLFAPLRGSSGEKKEIKLFEDKKSDRLEFRGLTWLTLLAGEAGYANIKTRLLNARMNRHFASTDMNAHSSRSHAILDICIRPVDDDSEEKYLRIIDLAGSERITKTHSSGQVMREGIKINESLMYLKRLIDLLAEQKIEKTLKEKRGAAKETNTNHPAGIDYRSTKLTRILFNSFRTGRARIVLILCCSPSRDNINETINTLEFGSNAKLIRTQLKQLQKRNSERKRDATLEQITQYNAEALLALEDKNKLINSYRNKIDEYEISVNALNSQLKLALQQQQDSHNRSAIEFNSRAVITNQFDDSVQPTRDELEEAKQEKWRVEKEKQALIKRLEQMEQAYRRCKETMKIQDDIIQQNTQDIMEMQNEINFFDKFRKNLIKTLGDDE